jgi:hypothetical protein
MLASFQVEEVDGVTAIPAFRGWVRFTHSCVVHLWVKSVDVYLVVVLSENKEHSCSAFPYYSEIEL